MPNLIGLFYAVFQVLIPGIEEALEPLTEQQQKLASILATVQAEKFIPRTWGGIGRPSKSRVALAHAFIAKAVYNLGETRELIELLKSTPNLRRICGYHSASEIPSESTFSRAFDEFARTELPQRLHGALIEFLGEEKIFGHISRDSTDVVAREKAAKKKTKKQLKAEAPKRKRGRPKKGETRDPPEPTRLERQKGMSIEEMLKELPKECDIGVKKKDGEIYKWKGFKAHIDWADGEIPISIILTSASVHDSQVAIPLMGMSSFRLTYFYELMDSAYDAAIIKEMSVANDHIPIIDSNPRGGEPVEMEPAQKRRYAERSTAERGNSFYKEGFGGGHEVRYRGGMKVEAHVMWAMVALAADRILNLFM
jgi:hypothetical protein